MIRLQTLGQLDLLAADGHELRAILAQPKRLALLIYLSLAPSRFCRRDTLVGLFWPELDAEHARGALRKAIYFLRQQAGEHLIAKRGMDELGLAEGAVDVDVVRFQNAAKGGDPEQALELYRGEFLAGFYVEGAPDVERWIESERERLRAIAVACAWEVAERAQAAGDYERARKWAEWALHAAPPSEAALRRLLSLLDKSGDRAAAFAAFHTFAERLEDDYGIAPSAATHALIDTLRSRVDEMQPRRQAAVIPAPPAAHKSHTPVEKSGWPRKRWLATAATAGAAVVIAAVLAIKPRTASPSDGAGRIAIMPFDAQTAPALNYLEEGLVVLLSTRLDGAGELRAVNARSLLAVTERKGNADDPAAIAARFNADLYVTGSAVQAGDQLVLEASLFRRGVERPLVRAQASGAEANLLAMVDDVARQLLAVYVRGRGGNFSETAVLTSGSLPALKAYLRGEEHLRAARYEAATTAFANAIAIDSMFALAYYRKSIATSWTGRMVESQADAEHAARLGSRLGERERLLVDVLAQRSRNSVEGERGYRNYLERYPDDLEAWFELAEVIFHHAPARGGSVADARPAFAQVIAIDPDHQPALVHLARIAAAEKNTEELARLTAHVIALAPKGGHVVEMRMFRATALNDRNAEDALIRDIRREGNARILDAAWRVSSYAHVNTPLRRIITRLEPELPGEWHSGLLLLDAYLTAANGEWPAAFRALDWVRPEAPVAALAAAGLFASDPRARIPRPELTRIRDNLARADIGSVTRSKATIFVGHSAPDTLDPSLRDFYVGAISLRIGDDTTAGQRLAAMQARPVTLIGKLATAQLSALIAMKKGSNDEALITLRNASTESAVKTASTSPFFPRPLLRRTIRDLLKATGRHDEALRWDRSLPEDLGFGVIYAD